MCADCDWESAAADCQELLSDPDFEFASDTLEGIKDWIETHEHVTMKQRDAIDNIWGSKE